MWVWFSAWQDSMNYLFINILSFVHYRNRFSTVLAASVFETGVFFIDKRCVCVLVTMEKVQIHISDALNCYLFKKVLIS
jgi:hypothetical protein